MRSLIANWIWLLIFVAFVFGFAVGGWSADGEKNSVLPWIANFFELKLTDAVIALFTVVLAVKTSGLFVETRDCEPLPTSSPRIWKPRSKLRPKQLKTE